MRVAELGVDEALRRGDVVSSQDISTYVGISNSRSGRKIAQNPNIALALRCIVKVHIRE